MKINWLISGILCFVIGPLFAQDTVYVYYDKDWKEIVGDSDTAYYRKAFQEKTKWIVQDYYVSGEIQMQGQYFSRKFVIKDGSFTYYYKNGNKSSEGLYVKNKLEGKWNYWNEDGGLTSTGKYLNHFKEGVWTYWYDNGKLQAKGASVNGKKTEVWQYYYESGELSLEAGYTQGVIRYATKYFENGNLCYKGSYKKGKQDGEWKYWNRDGRLANKGEFDKGIKDGTWTRFYKEGSRSMVFKKGIDTSGAVGGIIRRD